MQNLNTQDVTDVEFKEVPVEKPAAAEVFNPVAYLDNALRANRLENSVDAWKRDLDPRAETAEDEKERIFFANRALRLFIAEIPNCDNIAPRMLLADGIDGVKWSALIDRGVIPWMLGLFDEKTGKRIDKSAQAAESTEETVKQTPPWEDLPEEPQKFEPTSHVEAERDEVVDNSATDDELRVAGFTTRTNPATGEVTALAPADARYEDEHGSGIPVDESQVAAAEVADARPSSSEPA